MRISAFLFLCVITAAVRPAPPQSLAGTWHGSFTLDSTSNLPGHTSSHSLVGRIEIGAGTSTDSLHPHPIYAGTSAIDFAPFGFRLGSKEVLGWFIGADSVKIILDPTVDHGHLELVGVQKGKTIEGIWNLLGEPAHARGLFVLTLRNSP